MKKSEIINKYRVNVKNLNKHNNLYFNKDKPNISDSEYDKIKKETLELEIRQDRKAMMKMPLPCRKAARLNQIVIATS